MISVTNIMLISGDGAVAEIFADDLSDISDLETVEGRKLSQGSTVYIIKTGDFYVMGGDGKWYIAENFKKKIENKIREIETFLVQKDLSSDIVWIEGGGIRENNGDANSGKIYSSAVFKYTEFISLDNVVEITITMPIYTTVSGLRASFGLAFYDADEKYISGYQFKQGENDIEKITLEVPENATQFRTTFYKDRESFVYIPLIKGSLPELEKRISALENATTNQN